MLKIKKIGRSAAKLLIKFNYLYGEGSTTIP